MSQNQLLIVHPDPSVQSLLASMLQSMGLGIEEAANERAAVRRLERGGVQLVLSSVDPADPDALEFLTYVRRKHPKIPVLLLFAGTNCDRAREAVRLGATVIRHPAPANELRASVTQAFQQAEPFKPAAPSAYPNGNTHNGMDHHRASGDSPRSASADHSSSNWAMPESVRPSARPIGLPVLGDSPSVRQAVETATAAAPTRTPIVIVGEQGTGKSLIARAVHAASPRHAHPFVEVVCGGLEEAQLERELFGQSFGGSDATALLDRPGKIAKADGGTLFLDEVTALTPGLQRRLLRLLQDGEFEPIGGVDPVKVDVRIILATHENLGTLVDQGRFRRDLYDRVGVVCLRLPPLRERGGDLETLAEHFRNRFAAEFAKPVAGFTADALDLLCRHDWPGNVRELESVIQRGVALCQGGRITSANLAIGFGSPRTARVPSYSPRPHMPLSIRPLKEALEEPEKQIIMQALQALNWNRQETARVLDINRTTLYKKMKKYGLLFDEPAMMN